MKNVIAVTKVLKAFLLFTVALTVGIWAVGQETGHAPAPTVNLDAMTKVFAIASTILGLCVGALQLYIANKIAKVKEEFNLAVVKVKEEFTAALHHETGLLEQRFQNHLEKLQEKVATREDISRDSSSIREFVKLSMEKIELQIKLSGVSNRVSQ